MASSLISRTLLSHRLLSSSSSSSSLSFLHKPLLSSQFFHTGILRSSTSSFSYNNLVLKRLVRRVISSTEIGAKSFCTQAMSTGEPVVSVEWLHSNLTQPSIKVVDASWYMPNEQRNPIQEYQVAHIPGALFFDVDGIADRTTNFYMKAGICKFGEACKFDHPVDRSASKNVKLTLAGYPRREGAVHCPFYMKTGTCKYGVTCKYDHPPPGEVVAATGKENAETTKEAKENKENDESA